MTFGDHKWPEYCFQCPVATGNFMYCSGDDGNGNCRSFPNSEGYVPRSINELLAQLRETIQKAEEYLNSKQKETDK